MALAQLDRFDEAKATAEQAVALAEAEQAVAFAETTGDPQLVEALAALRDRLAEPQGPPSWQPHLEAGVAAVKAGEPLKAISALEQAIKQATLSQAPGPEASARGVIAALLRDVGRPGEGLPHARRALAIATQLDDDEARRQFEALVADLESNPSSDH